MTIPAFPTAYARAWESIAARILPAPFLPHGMPTVPRVARETFVPARKP